MKNKKFLPIFMIIVCAAVAIAFTKLTEFARLNSYDASEFQVIVARYNEDITWLLRDFPNDKVIIYNKGLDDLPKLPSNYEVVKLPNLGRESDTILHHIIHSYYNLSNTTLFLQGKPFDHNIIIPLWLYKYPALSKPYIFLFGSGCDNVIALVCVQESIIDTNEEFKNYDWKNTKWYDTTNAESIDFIEFRRRYLGIDDVKKIAKVFYGAQFVVTKSQVRLHTIDYYKNIKKTLQERAPITSHYLERSWDAIFASSFEHQ